MNFDGWDTAPRRGRGRGGKAAGIIGLLVVVVAALLVGRALLSRGSPAAQGSSGSLASGSLAGGQSAAMTSPAGQLSLGACIDPTASLVPSFAPGIRADLASAIASLAPSGELDTTATAPGQPVSQPQAALDLTVRQVDTTSFASTMTTFTRTVQVPGIPGLTASRPEPGSANYATQLDDWSQDYAQITADRRSAAAAAASASHAIGSLPLDDNAANWSAISACVSALLLTVPAGGSHSYLLASDLEEDVAAQLAGSFRGSPLVIIQACDSGNASYCQGLLSGFEREMRRLDVGPITVIRPEDAAAAIDQWVQTGEVSS